MLGLNGLYALLELVTGLGPAHQHLATDYETLLSNAFGPDQGTWRAVSPAHFDPAELADQVSGLRVVKGHRCTGKHAIPWEQGDMIWQNVDDIFRLLREEQ